MPSDWPENRLTELLGIELPIIQAPMAGASGADMTVAVSNAGGLGSLPCAMLNATGVRDAVEDIRNRTEQPFNLNFFCHEPSAPDANQQARWLEQLMPFFKDAEVEPATPPASGGRAPFDESMCALVETLRPAVASFHFGLPDSAFIERAKAAGTRVLSSATTVAEARWLEQHGCDAIIAQGCEAGGHRGIFLGEDIATQPGTFALVPQIVDAVSVPVIAAGGIADGRGIAAAFALGASGVQLGTAYLFTPEATISELHRTALNNADDQQTALTNLFSGRPARGLMNGLMRSVGPMSDYAPAFPTAGSALAPLRAHAEALGRTDFTPLWSGQAAGLGKERSAAALTEHLAADARQRLRSLTIPAAR